MSQDELDTSTGVEEVIDLDDPEPRWPGFVAVIAVGGLYTALPDALTMGPRWLFPSAVLALLVPTIVSHHAGKHRVNAIFGFAVDAVLTIGLIVSVILLIGALPTHKQAPLELLLSAAALWATNILVFALWYWRLDAGGPHQRDKQWRLSLRSLSLSPNDDERTSARNSGPGGLVAGFRRLFISFLQY